MIDTNDFPDLSSVKTESDEVPPLPASGFEISSIEDLQYRSWVAVDARGVYLSDWDKGFPTNTANYEHAHEEQMGGHWDYEVEPNCKCTLGSLADTLQGVVLKCGHTAPRLKSCTATTVAVCVNT